MTPPPEDAPADPRALARKLAQEAKARALAKQLAEQAKARAAAAAPPKPAAPAKPKKSLAERAKKPMSAKEALRRAIEAEERAAEEAREAKAAAPAPAPVAAPPPVTPPPVVAPAPVAAPAPAPVATAAPAAAPVVLKDPAVVIANRLPGVTVRSTVVVDQRAVFKALWTAHRARAQVEGRLDVMVTADVLTDAANRLPDGALYAARASRGDEVMAVWVDVVNGVVLGIAEPADVFLAGL